jgi:4-hydroxybenzoate polyprenyltransferase
MGARLSRSLTSKLRAYVRLGRVSNLPTVWTNVAAGAVLSGARPSFGELALTVAALTSMYVAGMVLNDAFDRHRDAVERAERPIPQGLVSAEEAFGVGFALLALGVVLVAPCGMRALIAATVLAGVIVLYDAWHEGNSLAPALMGVCRALVYVTASMAVVEGALRPSLLAGAAALFAYVLGLSHAARFETKLEVRSLAPLAGLLAPLFAVGLAGGPLVQLLAIALLVWIAQALSLVRSRRRGAIGEAVARLIAGISLVDALLIATQGAGGWALVAACGLPLTRIMQRRVPGT